MNLAETIYQHSLNLPEAAAREALDFIEFLEYRHARSLLTSETTSWEAQVRSLAFTLSSDFPDDIGDSDLGVDSPRQDMN